MKIRYIKTLAFVGALALASSCNDNSWNDEYLDGFEGGPTYTGTVTVTYTLTQEDYVNIGKTLYAISETQEEKDAANAIQNNHYFDQLSPYPAQVAVPYLLNAVNQGYASDFFIYNNGSVVQVNLRQAEVPEEVRLITGANMLELPEETATSSIPGTLLSEFPDAEKGDYAIVTLGGSEGPSTWTVAQALAQMQGGYEGEATVAGVVSSITEISTSYGNATYFIKDNLTDEASLEVFRGYGLDNTKFTSEDQLQVGAKVTVTGNLVNYNGTLEFTSGNYITSYEAPATKSRAANLTDNIKNLQVGATLTATAVVTAQSTRGLVLTDNGGSIFYYKNNVDLETYKIGTVVNVSGAVSAYGTGLQLSDSATITVAGTETVTYPTPVIYTASMIESAIASSTTASPNTAQYVTFEGKMNISGSYYNIDIDGVTSGQGSLYAPSAAIAAQLVSGNTYKYTGYYTGVTNNKYFYMVLTGVELISEGGTGGGNTGGGNSGGGNSGGDNGSDTPAATGSNLIYQFDGSKWALAKEAVVMNPQNYEDMGLVNNKLTDPAIYIPIYLKSEFPYTAAGTVKYVAYNLTSNGCSCGIFTYDGYNWIYTDNYIENKLAAYSKSNGAYKFWKYIGEEVFVYYNKPMIKLNASYLIVADSFCANPVAMGKNYDYLQVTEINISDDGVVIMPNGDNAFSFLTSAEYSGNTYYTPEGTFVIKDSNNRYLYCKEGYNNFNVRAENPYITDNAIDPQYLFTATRNEDGTWYLTNVAQKNHICYSVSSSYQDFAIYDQARIDQYSCPLPFLYILESDMPDDDENQVEE